MNSPEMMSGREAKKVLFKGRSEMDQRRRFTRLRKREVMKGLLGSKASLI